MFSSSVEKVRKKLRRETQKAKQDERLIKRNRLFIRKLGQMYKKHVKE